MSVQSARTSVRLWDWAAKAWARKEVEAAALELQDIHGQNVPLLLWAAWAAGQGRRLDQDTFDEAADVARAWETVAVLPLRSLRRTLKKPVPDMDGDAREALRAQVKAVEAGAERALLEALEPIAPKGSGGATSIDQALVSAARAWGRTTPRVALKSFAAMLSG